ncbi:MAG TPA: 3-phosphoserine/phosphohydroxythreonine transaminase [Crocinitomicaceae bacterium]|nr:3-phosphoserine/phosphohydroxythreonine transaminase [Crocinitomicaceae bacterium]
MKHNFGAGPCILPQTVFKQASDAVLDFNGLSLLEVSHRSPDFVEVMEEVQSLVKKTLNVPAGYSVLFLQGGASLGFTITALNMMRDSKKAGYINTGTWAKGAIAEAKAVGIDVNVFASSEDQNFNYIPKNFTVPSDVDFIHYTSNNTIFGTQFKSIVETNAPLVCDMSSDIFSQKIDVSKFDIIYAGAQKNLGPAGATLYIVKDEILGKSSSEFMPKYLNLKNHADKGSMMNTPPVFSVYTSMLNLRNLIANGGVDAAAERNKAKADLLYNEIDSNPLFKSAVSGEDRSLMNVTFLLNDDTHKGAFDTMWNEAGIIGLKGHRSVGGYRASMYNALTIESVQVLTDIMKELGRTKG